jgi:hypothetical protein
VGLPVHQAGVGRLRGGALMIAGSTLVAALSQVPH